jgi:dTDP-4-dehydrorhamnose reductase
MKLLLFGANGQVGTELRRSLAPLGEVIATTRTGLLPDGSACIAADFDVPQSLPGLIERVAPDVVVNAAAYTAVDRAEDDVDAAYRTNTQAPAAIAAACAARHALLVHYSTDYIFDGSGTRPYRETDAVHPLGVYGESKLAGEQAVQASGSRHVILRTAWVYSWDGHNFMRTMLRLAAERDELRVVSDQIGSPTPAALIADMTSQVLLQGPTRSGLWHLTAAGWTSWKGFADAILEKALECGVLSRRPRVVPIESIEYPTRARRPAYSVLDCARLEGEFKLMLPEWSKALDGVFAESPAKKAGAALEG